jgi:hypothetical protein
MHKRTLDSLISYTKHFRMPDMFIRNLTNATMSTDRNISDSELDDMLAFERVVHLTVSLIFGIIVLLGFLGNLLVIIVVWSNTQMQNTTNILIVSLAFADLCKRIL